MPRGFGGPIMRHRGIGWMWWGLGVFGMLFLFVRLIFLFLPFIMLGMLIYLILRH